MLSIMPSSFTTPDAKAFAGKYTLYHRSMLGHYVPIEVKDVSVGLIPFAQYANGVRIEFTKKGARSRRAYVETTHPSTILLPGWGHAITHEAFTEPIDTSYGVAISRGRHMSCDPAWDAEFDAMLTAYCAAKGIIPVVDTRSHRVTTRP